MGAAMAGCGPTVMTMLGEYGDAIGEAFQMRDDVLGIFGSPAVTGKPAGSDLAERKATRWRKETDVEAVEILEARQVCPNTTIW